MWTRGFVGAVLGIVALGCSGPAAPDAEVCRDVVDRLCTPPVCQQVTDTLAPGGDCVGTLLTRTGCDRDDFGFTDPSRDRFLECRRYLLQGSGDFCGDVQHAFEACPDLVRFLGGAQ